MQTPLYDFDEITAALTANNLPPRLPTVGGYKLNCWGFVAFYHGWVDCQEWLRASHMDDLLDEHSYDIPASDVRPGDIAVLRDADDNLEHTALVVVDGFLLHKPGQGDLCVETAEAVKGRYKAYGPMTLTYRRPLS